MLCERHTNAGGISQSPKSKYLIPGSSKAVELQKALSEDIGAAPSAAVHLYINNTLPVDLDALLFFLYRVGVFYCHLFIAHNVVRI